MLKRYTLPAMWALWGREETKFERWLDVELAFLKARAELGEIPASLPEEIRSAGSINVKRIEEIEEETQHDMIAFIKSVQEVLMGAGIEDYGELHKKLTSYNVEDPALMLMLRNAAELIIKELMGLENALRTKAHENAWALMIARTHVQFAEPSTFGHLLLVFAEAIRRSIRRLERVLEDDLSEGNMSGAVGTYAGINPELEIRALAHLGLKPAFAETQILQRDRHASFLCNLAIAAGSIQQIATTFHELMRSEVHELEEPRRATQRGSSTMPHKKNPILTERMIGMARLVQACSHVALENIATKEWRSIEQSAPERHIIPDATSLIHYMANKMTGMVNRLVIFQDKMRTNLDVTSLGVWAGQPVRLVLMDAGVSYDDAYLYVQQCAFKAVEDNTHIMDIMAWYPINGRKIEELISKEKLKECFNAEAYVKDGIEYIFSRAKTR